MPGQDWPAKITATHDPKSAASRRVVPAEVRQRLAETGEGVRRQREPQRRGLPEAELRLGVGVEQLGGQLLILWEMAYD
jgi:hypothetical protein